METQLQGRQDWPFPAMASFLDATTNSGSSSNGFLFEWDYLRFGVGLGEGDADAVHELFPLCMESPAASTAAVVRLPPVQDFAALPEGLDGLFQNLWDATSYGDVGGQVAFSSSCATVQEASSFSDDDLLSSIFSKGGASLQEKILSRPQAEPLCSSSSDCHRDPQFSDPSGVQQQAANTPTGPTSPDCHRDPQFSDPSWVQQEEVECSQSSKKREVSTEAAYPLAMVKSYGLDEKECSGISKRRKVSSAVVYPFALMKPDGLDGRTTLDDINRRILTRPARPVRHAVGEFACSPRISTDKPGPSGKMVVSLTRLHTGGSGTLTIIRTRG